MPILTDNLLRKLVCSSCKKYLSIPPIKVYSDNQIKCGRCCEEHDGGAKSLLYEMVVKDLKFPCINHMEGCAEYLPISEMGEHENQCMGNTYYCPACFMFEGSSYAMSLHIKMEHDDLLLKDKNVLVNVETFTKRSVIYFYYDIEVLLFITVELSEMCDKPNEIYIELKIARSRNNTDVFQQLMIYSANNKLLHDTNLIKYTEWNETYKQDIICLCQCCHKVGNVFMCRFDIIFKSAELLPFQECPRMILDPSAKSAELKCKFSDINKLELNKKYFSLATFYVMDIPWKICIMKQFVNEVYYLSCYLDKQEKKTKCYTIHTFILVSKVSNKNVYSSYKEKNDYSTVTCWGVADFVEWDVVTDPNNGFIEDDSIKIQIILDVEPNKSKEIDICSLC